MNAAVVRAASEIRPKPVSWLWPGCLAEGQLAMLDGDPGIGKSLLTLDLAARVSTGRPFPDERPSSGPASVLLLCAEDNEATILARLARLDADLTRVFVWSVEDVLPRFPSEAKVLDEEVERTGAKLVVIDPVVAFLDPSVHVAGDANVRRAFAPLAGVARKHGCAMVLVRHLNKQNGAAALYRGGGSIAFVAACRLAWLAAPNPRVSGRFILAQQKNNLGPLQPSLAYALPEDGPRVEWLGRSPWHADDLAHRKRRPLLQRACEFLRSLLEAGPRPVKEIWDAAQAAGHTKMTLRRAKKDLRLRTQRVDRNDTHGYYWLLPNQMLPPELQGPLDKYLQPLIEQYGNRCPLEDDDEMDGEEKRGRWEDDEERLDAAG